MAEFQVPHFMWFNTLIDFILNNRTIYYIRLIFLVAIFVAILGNMRLFGDNAILVMYFYIVRHYFLGITWLGHIHLFLCMPEELRYICLGLSAAILAAILKNMQLLLLWFTYLIYTSFISYESTLYSFLYPKAEMRYIRFRFSAVILAAILENVQLLLLFFTYLISTSFISYESTLHSFLYLKAELRYIRSRISAAILAAILNCFPLYIRYYTTILQ